MRKLFITARLKTMYAEFKRINGFAFTKRHLSSSWKMASPTEKYLGRPYYFAVDYNNQFIKGSDGESIKITRLHSMLKKMGVII